jgi:CHAT domain-containing protein/tetratricopeptide (TPR) repeat protein
VTRNRKSLLPATALLAVCAAHAGAVEPARFDTIRDLIDRGEYVEAERRARFALDDIERSGSPDRTETAMALDLVVESLRHQNRAYTSDVAAMTARALAIRRQAPDDDDAALARSLVNMAFVRRDIDLDVLAALALSEEALSVAESALRPGDARLAPYLTEHAVSLLDAGRYGKAELALRRALGLANARGSPHGRARALAVNGSLLSLRASHEEAAATYEEAAAVLEEAFGPDHPDVAALNREHARSLMRLGRHGEARRLSERCRATAESAYGREHPLTAKCLLNLAWIERERGSPVLSRRLYEDSIAVLERTLGPEHPALAEPSRQLGWLLRVSWELIESKEVHERGIRILEGFYGERDQRIGWLLNGYGDLLRWLGDLEGARSAFERAIALVDASAEPDRLLRALSLGSLGTVRGVLGDFEEALALVEQARSLLDEVLPKDDPDRAEVIQANADLLAASGDHARALPLMEQAVEMRRRVYGEDHFRNSGALIGYANLLDRTGDRIRARELRRQALAVREKAFGAEGVPVGMLLRKIARDEHAAGDHAEAFRTALRAERIRTRALRLTVAALPERQALAFASGLPGARGVLVTLASLGGADAALFAPATWDSIVRSRALVLDELATRHRSFHAEGLDPALLVDLTLARERVAGLVVRGAVEDYREQFQDALAEKERLETALAAKSADFQRLRRQAAVGLADVEAALPPDSALVAFVRYEHHATGEGAASAPGSRGADSGVDRRSPRGRGLAPSLGPYVSSYAAFVLTPGTTGPLVVSLGSAGKIDALIESWRNEVSRRPPSIKNESRAAMQRYLRSGEELRQAVWDPVAKHVEGSRRVFVVPDGNLHLLNLPTLPGPRGGFLLDGDPEFHYLSSERDLVLAGDDEALGALLALGAADFDSSPGPPALSMLEGRERFPFAAASKTSPALYRGERPDCEGFRDMRFLSLPATEREIDEISASWAETGEVDTLRGVLAHETLLKAGAGGHGAIHVATHGFVLDDCLGPDLPKWQRATTNPLLLSGLALAGANNRAEADPGEDDGILTAEEVGSLDLTGVGWVVLSGCDTGTGRVVADEGVLGLRRAFRIAGARSLIMSLWPVDDDATRRWMRALYAARKDGASTSGSVAHAARTVLRENLEAGLPAHPFYWGAFVAAGDWR